VADDDQDYANIRGPLPAPILSELRRRIGGQLKQFVTEGPSGYGAVQRQVQPEWAKAVGDPAARAIYGAGQAAANVVRPFGEAWQRGVAGDIPTVEEQIPAAAEAAKAMVGFGSPFAVRGALGAAGGRALTSLEHPFDAPMRAKALELFPGEGNAELRQALEGRSYQQINDPETASAFRQVYENTHGPMYANTPELDRVEPLTNNEILHTDYPAAKPRSRNVEDIAKDLHDRGVNTLTDLGVPEGKITGPGEHDPLIANAIASELMQALRRNNHAGDWYTGKIRDAQAVAGVLHPEVLEDPNHLMAWNAGLAITSQGEKVPSNVRLADQAFNYYKQNGRFPTDLAAKEGEQINGNFLKLNKLLDELGPDGARQFLHTKFKVRDLEARGYDIEGEKKDAEVWGSAIFGPKIGGGFYQNLTGNYDPVTMDLWFMRGWGRLTGSLVGRPTEKPFNRFRNALGAAGEAIPNSDEALISRAAAVNAQHERDFKQFRSEYDSGARTKSELTLAAQRVLANARGINEQPLSAGHREWIRDVWNHARSILSSYGHNISNADMQALWWYPEKDLYAKLGSVPSEGINVDYASALRDLARARGIPDETVEQAISAAYRRSRSTAAGDVGAGSSRGGARRARAYGGEGPDQTEGLE